MSRPSEWVRPDAVVRAGVLGAVVLVAAALAVRLRLAGHDPGDDFALYLRQARSLFDGDMAAVIGDNRFSVLNSDPEFSPIAYPWGWPLLLSPFVGVWGLAYDRLKLVEIAVFCVWLVLLHGIVRRRLGRIAAFAVVLVVGTAPAYLTHTDQLLSEFPQLAAVAVVIWWHDRVRSRGTLLSAPSADLAVLGLLVAVAVNTRRESIVLLPVLVGMQLADAWRESRSDGSPGFATSLQLARRALVVPVAAFAAGAVAFQLLLPAELLPDNGNDLAFLDDRWREYPGIVADQLGLGERPWLGLAILLLAGVGAAIGVRRRPGLDTPLLALALLSALLIGTHFRQIDRYWFQVTPWVLYFAVVALRSAATGLVQIVPPRANGTPRALPDVAAVVPLLLVVVAHAVVLPGRLSDAREFNDAGRIQDGPAHPSFVSMAAAVEQLTRPDAVVAFYRARTMTLVTDRRAIQTHDLGRILGRADYWVQRRDSSFWQPGLDEAEVRAVGLTSIWEDERFVIWSVPPGD